MKKKAQVGNVQAPSALEAGREAAIACVEVLADFQSAALATPGGELPDYRPHVGRLYSALRNGWEPICRCWPQLSEERFRFIFSQVDPLSHVADQIARPLQAPALAWDFAESLFWITVVNTAHHESALEAWHGWVPEYSPAAEDDPGYPEVDVDTWIHIKYYVSHFPKDWGKLIDDIKATSPTMPEEELRSVPPPRKPTLPQPTKPLPANRAALERLAKRVDECVDGFKRGLLKETGELYYSWVTFRFRALASDADVSESKYDADFREVFPYLDDLEPYLDPVTVAVSLHHAGAQRVRSSGIASSVRRHKPSSPASQLATSKRYTRGLDALLAPYGQLQNQIVARLEAFDVRSKEPTSKRRKKRGRTVDPKITKRDDDLLKAWETGHYRTYKDVGREFDMTDEAVRKALPRARRRRGKKRKSKRT